MTIKHSPKDEADLVYLCKCTSEKLNFAYVCVCVCVCVCVRVCAYVFETLLQTWKNTIFW